MSMAADDPVVPPDAPGLRPLPQLIFSSRWLQVPLYLGLIVAQGVYVVLFLKELRHLVLGAMNFTEQEIDLLSNNPGAFNWILGAFYLRDSTPTYLRLTVPPTASSEAVPAMTRAPPRSR